MTPEREAKLRRICSRLKLTKTESATFYVHTPALNGFSPQEIERTLLRLRAEREGIYPQ